MTKEEIFYNVSRHLKTQNARAVRRTPDGQECAYRAPSGLRCAVGGILDDSVYVREMEGRDVNRIARWLPAEFQEHLTLLSQLQVVHDCFVPEAWGRALRRVAVLHDIEPNNSLFEHDSVKIVDDLIQSLEPMRGVPA